MQPPGHALVVSVSIKLFGSIVKQSEWQTCDNQTIKAMDNDCVGCDG